MKFYQYPKCSTCRRAEKFLKQQNIDFESIDISIQPPSKDELIGMIKAQGDKKKLFNTSGMLYREMDVKSKLPGLDDEAAAELLSKNGMLIKRPFVIGNDVALVGFKEELWLQITE